MTDRDRVSRKELLRSLYFNRTGILLLLMLFSAIGMIALSAGTTGTPQQFWLAMGTGTMATTVYSIVQVFLTTAQFEQFLVGSIRSVMDTQVTSLSRRVMEDYTQTQRRFLPTAQYSSAGSPEPAFNRDINRSCQASEHYVFRGITGKYAAARLGLLSSTPAHVKLIIADPTKPASGDSRARLMLMTDRVGSLREGREKIVHDIHLALAGTYLIHARFDTLELCFTADPHIDRVEIFDHEIYLELFSSPAEAERFPPTMRFARESFVYQTYSRDCSRLLTSPYVKQLAIPHGMDVPEFLDLLKGRAEIDISADRFEEIIHEFNDFQRQAKNGLIP